MVCLDPILNLTRNKSTQKDNPILRILKSIFITACWTLSLIFFRAKGFDAAIECFKNIGVLQCDIFSFGLTSAEIRLVWILLAFLLAKELIWKRDKTVLPSFFYNKVPLLFRWIFYIAFVLSMVYFGQYGGANENVFIYFQF